jgi:hypothetical protein
MWLISVSLATQEPQIRKIMVQSQSSQVVLGDPILKKKITQKRAGRVAQGIGPEFKSRYHKKNTL